MTQLETRHGKLIDITNFKPEDVVIEDIAYSLANQCAYFGHTYRFYSLAEQAVLISSRLQPEYRLQGLLSTAYKAYLGTFPILDGLAPYKDKITSVIYTKFSVDAPEEATPFLEMAVKSQEITDAEELFGSKGQWIEGYDISLVNKDRLPFCLTPNSAYKLFMDTFRMLASQESITKIFIED